MMSMTMKTPIILLLLLLLLFQYNYAMEETNDMLTSTTETKNSLTLSSLSNAMSMSYHFFGTLIHYTYRLVVFVTWPFICILSWLWTQLVIKPYALAAHVAHLLYPVTMFCLAAVCCGAVIGGFAGFAAEACSSLVISATWGPDAEKKNNKSNKKTKAKAIREVIDEVEPDADMLQESEEEEEDEDGYDLFSDGGDNQVPIVAVPVSSSSTRKGKEPMRPRMESWRDSFTSSSSSRSSPGLIRRMKMSSTDTLNDTRRKNSWEWEDDENEFGAATTITRKPLA